MTDITLTPDQIAAFHRDGAITVPAFASPAEVASAHSAFNALICGALPIPGADIGEHTPGLLNVTAFSLYHPLPSLGVLAELDRRALRVTEQLYGEEPGAVFARDYEQLLRKLAGRPGSVFPPHWDQMYWPRSRSGAFDLRTATFSLALTPADERNGCLWVLPGSQALKGAYAGAVTRLQGSREKGGGVIEVRVLPEDLARRRFLPLRAGDATFHGEWVLHGSEANRDGERSRDTLIFAYRAKRMIEVERALGFRHSYNDADETLRRVRTEEFE